MELLTKLEVWRGKAEPGKLGERGTHRGKGFSKNLSYGMGSEFPFLMAQEWSGVGGLCWRVESWSLRGICPSGQQLLSLERVENLLSFFHFSPFHHSECKKRFPKSLQRFQNPLKSEISEQGRDGAEVGALCLA